MESKRHRCGSTPGSKVYLVDGLSLSQIALEMEGLSYLHRRQTLEICGTGTSCGYI